MALTDDFIRYGTIGGAYAGSPNEIASLFKERNLKQEIDKPLILNYLNGREEKWPRALDYIKYYIDLFRQWAYRRADGDKQLLQEIDNYINSLYEWLKQGKEKGQLDDIELTRLKAQKESLTDKLYDHVPERLIAEGQESIDRLVKDIENSEHITDYPPNPSFKWHNSEIERLSLLSEKIKLLMRLVKKIHPEDANKYDYLYYLGKITGDIAGFVGTLELSRDNLDWGIIDRGINDVREDIKRHFSELKERLTAAGGTDKPAETEQNTTVVKDKQENAKGISNINIQNFHGILGDIQAENVQTGDHASIQNAAKTQIHKEKVNVGLLLKKIIGWIFKKMSHFIITIIVGVVVAVLVDILGDFGWIQQIKDFIHKIAVLK